MHMRLVVASVVAAFSASSLVASAADLHVAKGGTGSGTPAAPFGAIGPALAVAQPGDTIVVAPGSYSERILTQRAGTAAAPIRIRAETRRTAKITSAGNVVTIAHPYVILEGLVLDGQDGVQDLVRIETAGSHTIIRDTEIANSRRDCVDMGGPESVLIEKSDIHHCLSSTTDPCATETCRVDAHGVVGGPVKDLVIRDTDIHDFSGDAVQVDPGRASPGWDRVTIERCKLWLVPLPAARNGFAAGVVPGENAVDTKTPATGRASLVVRDTVAYGFRKGLIGNMAAFNVKERVDASFDRVTVRDSEIAFRLRGPSITTLANVVMFDVDVGVRYEDGTTPVTMSFVTFGRAVTQPFVEASSAGTSIAAKNVLFLGATLPSVLAGTSNLAVSAAAFVDAAKDDYHLAPSSPAIDKGEAIATITSDRDGLARTQGKAPDVGAYESCEGPCVPAPAAPSADGGSAPDGGGESAGAGADGGAGGEASSADDGCSCRTAGRHRREASGFALLALALLMARRSLRRSNVR
jgi:hypothetical protein